eukprot:10377765-Karenia_brevis.AAC.1
MDRFGDQPLSRGVFEWCLHNVRHLTPVPIQPPEPKLVFHKLSGVKKVLDMWTEINENTACDRAKNLEDGIIKLPDGGPLLEVKQMRLGSID